MKIANVFIVTVIALVAASCGEYNKVLKSDDLDYKMEKAIEYYEEGRCYSALPVFEELIALTRGTQRAEQVYYYHAKSHYCGGDYYLANYYFNNFIKNFSYSPLTEECQFLAAKCSYNLSPNYRLDQTDTKLALTELQLFIDKYPHSELSDSCQTMIRTLNEKLEKKSYEIAKLYVKTENFKSADVVLQNAIKDFPSSPYKEEMMFLIVKASYLYATKSIEDKKLVRFTKAVDHYFNFVAYYPKSKWLRQAENYFENSRKEIDRLKSIG